MLSDLKQAHEQLLAGIADLAELIQQDRPDPERLAQVRWRLSRASGARRRLVEQACEQLVAGGGSEVAERLRNLRDTGAEMLSASSRHIGTWTIDQILADWGGYRLASAMMRKSMRARIDAERAILYPLLEHGRPGAPRQPRRSA